LPVFTYKAVSASGETVEGELEVRNQQAVVERLQDMGYIPIRIDTSDSGSNNSRISFDWFNSDQVTQAEVGVFTREIAILLEAGLPLDRALEILVTLSENDKVRVLLNQIMEDVRGGDSLSEALAKHDEVFTRFYVSMVKAGEAGGALGTVLSRITEFMERAKALRDTVTSALIYPSVLVVASTISVLMLLIFVVPQFSVMFEQSGQLLPLPTRIVIGAGDFLQSYWWLLLAAGWGAYEFGRRQLADPAKKYRLDAWLLNLPMVGDLTAKVEIARFSRSLGILLGNGVTLLNSLVIIKDTLSNSVIAEGIEIISTQLKQGRGLGEPMMEAGLFPELAVHMVLVGEETGQLEAMLLKVADVYDEEVQGAVKRMLALMEPVLILGMGLLIGGIIMSILLAILSVNDLAM